MENEKKQNREVDEAFLMSAMSKGREQENQLDAAKEPTNEKPPAKEKIKQKKTDSIIYSERFLKNHALVRRSDKSIYVSQEYHERLSRIVQVIGEDKIPLYAYLDKILEHHFELFEKAITDSFNDKYKPIF
ncbi:DUF3408 domain-containing protein [Flavobacterium sp.]|uniref:DUF3408 domain-containing protein n=1 Tax=Flavobacterium sp. TaxID=239 RepID=UPI003D6B02A6